MEGTEVEEVWAPEPTQAVSRPHVLPSPPASPQVQLNQTSYDVPSSSTSVSFSVERARGP
jgi:hypothetical protein